MNYGESDAYPRFEFPIEETKSQEWMEGAARFIELGGAVTESQARERLGLDEPEEDDDEG